jgi:fluoride exporter
MGKGDCDAVCTRLWSGTRETLEGMGGMGRISLYVWVAAGGALGSVGRAWLGAVVASLAGEHFPWGTLLINVLGSFVIGWFGALTDAGGRFDVHANMRVFVMVGICGGFTTFSAFSLQTLELLQMGAVVRAGLYILGSVVLCLLGVWLGTVLGRG